MKKSVFNMAVILGLAAILAGCSGPREGAAKAEGKAEASSEIKAEAGESGTEASKEAAGTSAKTSFTVGFDQDFPPMGFVGDDGEYTGFDLELAKEVADRLGMEFVPQPIAWDAKDMELESGNIDCIWNGFTMTGREDKYTWSTPYMENSQVFVVTKASGMTKLEDLAGKIVEVQADSSAEAALKENQELSATFKTLQTTPNYNTAFMDLEMGAVDAIAIDSVVADYQLEQRKGDYLVLDEALASEKYAIGFKKGNEALKQQVEEQLGAMAKDGTMTAISEKWFGKDVTTVGK